MLVPVKWLKDYVEIDVPVKELAHRLTMTGTKVESIVNMGEEISNVVVGKILSIERHPGADKLVVCKVDVGNEVVQIVTGAPNVKEGQLVPVALHGATLPGGKRIKRARLRGVESYGMMCSGEELGLKEEDYPGAEEYGVLILREDYTPGTDIKKALDLNGEVIEFEITSNRPDCLSMIGIAREAAVAIDKNLTLPEIQIKTGTGDVNKEASVCVEEPELCPRYCARVIKDVKIGPSPQWMRRRLAAAGIRPINNIVDITNYVMLEFGQPLHAFDLDKLAQKKIVVRKARDGEKIVTLDGEERQLTPDMLIIADAEKPIAVAGVMGGANSEIGEKTTNVLFESAKFDGTSVRLTSKALGLRSEASSRFEKGLDINNTVTALNRAVQLVQELGIGTVVEGVIDVCNVDLEPKILEVEWRRINKLLGLDLQLDEISNILRKLDFEVQELGEFIRVKVPSFRQDIEGVVDLAEEVARIYGYNNIPMTFMEGTAAKATKSRRQRLLNTAKQVLTGMGLYEAVTYSFTSPKVYYKLGITDEKDFPMAVKIANPLGEDQSIMRTTLIPSLLEVLSRNYNRRMEECQIFEINRTYHPKSLPLEELPLEKTRLAIGEYGPGLDFYDLKGKVELLLETFGLVDEVEFVAYKHPSFHPGRTALLKLGEKEIGILGEIHPKVSTNFQLNVRTLMAELDFDAIIEHARVEKHYVPLPKYPAVDRDLSFIVKKDMPAARVERLIREAGGQLLEKVQLFDIYEGSQVPKGCKSMAYSLSFRAPDRTLKDEEVNKLHQKIVSVLEEELGARLR